MHDNISAKTENGKPDLKFSQVTKYNIVGAPNEFPYISENDIFDVGAVISSIIHQ